MDVQNNTGHLYILPSLWNGYLVSKFVQDFESQWTTVITFITQGNKISNKTHNTFINITPQIKPQSHNKNKRE